MENKIFLRLSQASLLLLTLEILFFIMLSMSLWLVVRIVLMALGVLFFIMLLVPCLADLSWDRKRESLRKKLREELGREPSDFEIVNDRRFWQ
ncbi:MAG: hypothetical protein BWK78_04735 [Thiotrichaceae bacterium IS1]|nr:MAG: hypothetical protein BWK78_04735 [Thiotrichaceae bacterium IS1]